MYFMYLYMYINSVVFVNYSEFDKLQKPTSKYK